MRSNTKRVEVKK